MTTYWCFESGVSDIWWLEDTRGLDYQLYGETSRRRIPRLPKASPEASVAAMRYATPTPGTFVRAALGGREFHPLVWRPGQSQPDHRSLYRDEWLSALHGARNVFDHMREVFRFVEPEKRNLKTYGHEIRHLLILACTEVEAQCKAVLRANRYRVAKNKKGEPISWNTSDYAKLEKAMHLSGWTVDLARYEKIRLKPFADWSPAKRPTGTESPRLSWYDAYNAVKHDRDAAFPQATLKNVLDALAAVQILVSAQFGVHPEVELKQGLDAPDFYTDPPEFPLETFYVPAPDSKKFWTPKRFKF